MRCSFTACNTAQPGSWRWEQLLNRQFFDASKMSRKKCPISSSFISTIPNPLMPGVSIRNVSVLISYISEKVVVCIPLWCELDISPVFAELLGTIWLIMVDLPTPELPDKSEILPANVFCSSVIPLPCMAVIFKHW